MINQTIRPRYDCAPRPPGELRSKSIPDCKGWTLSRAGYGIDGDGCEFVELVFENGQVLKVKADSWASVIALTLD